MRLFFSVGEPSGDQHAARLITELRSRFPEIEVSAYGGPKMEAAGCRLHYQLTDLAVMGFFQFIPLLGKFLALVRRAQQILRDERPDAVVLVDFPGFNWWIAWRAKKLGIPVFYYLPPQLWAWAPWRIRRVKKNVDHVLCGLSFEQRWYRERGIAADYVGHPFFDEIRESTLNEDFMCTWGDGEQRNVGVLPGSRSQEVVLNWPIMVDCISRLSERHTDTRYLVACFNESHRDRCQQILAARGGSHLPIHFFVGRTSEIIQLADCCLMVSGSVSLEMLARATPAVVVYYFGWVSGFLARLLVHCKYASLPNLMADQGILPEFFPHGRWMPTADQITAKLSSWMSDHSQLDRVRRQLTELDATVNQTGSIDRAVNAITERLAPAVVKRAA